MVRDFNQPVFLLLDRIVVDAESRSRLVDAIESGYREAGEVAQVGDVKIARRAVAVYFRSMHAALSQLIVLPKGGV